MTRTEQVRKDIQGLSEVDIAKYVDSHTRAGEALYFEHSTRTGDGGKNHPHVEVWTKGFKRRLGCVVCTWLDAKC
jgi:3'-phosphoadenosine 5'-phosphosulfate sulfotransferase (PAPS reductase)/FAD synthetase